MSKTEFSTLAVAKTLRNASTISRDELLDVHTQAYLMAAAFPGLTTLRDAQIAFSVACHPAVSDTGRVDLQTIQYTANALANVIQGEVGDKTVYLCQQPIYDYLCGLPLMNGMCDHGGRL